MVRRNFFLLLVVREKVKVVRERKNQGKPWSSFFSFSNLSSSLELNRQFLVDSGATHDMENDIRYCEDITKCSIPVSVGNGETFTINSKGFRWLKSKSKSGNWVTTRRPVLISSRVPYPVVSVNNWTHNDNVPNTIKFVMNGSNDYIHTRQGHIPILWKGNLPFIEGKQFKLTPQNKRDQNILEANGDPESNKDYQQIERQLYEDDIQERQSTSNMFEVFLNTMSAVTGSDHDDQDIAYASSSHQHNVHVNDILKF